MSVKTLRQPQQRGDARQGRDPGATASDRKKNRLPYLISRRCRPCLGVPGKCCMHAHEEAVRGWQRPSSASG